MDTLYVQTCFLSKQGSYPNMVPVPINLPRDKERRDTVIQIESEREIERERNVCKRETEREVLV